MSVLFEVFHFNLMFLSLHLCHFLDDLSLISNRSSFRTASLIPLRCRLVFHCV